MIERSLRAASIFVAASLVASGTITVSGQMPLRTQWSDPDLQGIWSSTAANGVPFERPSEFGLRAQLTDAEFAERASAVQRQASADAAEFVAPGNFVSP